MAQKLIAPRPGEGVEELMVVKWLKKEGDPVKEFEPVVEVETDKVVTEIPSPAAGVLLKILANQDSLVKVGSVMAWIGQPGETLESSAKAPPAAPEAQASQPPAETPADVEAPEPVKTETRQRATPVEMVVPTAEKTDEFISPLVRKIAAEYKVDVSQVTGTGLEGRVTKQDILAYVDSTQKSGAAPAPAASSTVQEPASKAGSLQPISNTRRIIAERMVNSVHTSPHVLTVMEADLSRVVAHRTALKPQYASEGVNLTLTAYFISAIVAGLKAFPMVNASWTDEGLLLHPDINVGMAVALGEAGLIVPVIKNADSLSLLGLAKTVNDLADRARNKKLQPDEVRGGTFSLTNHGTGGSLFASPIITQPQVAILGTGSMQKRAVVVTDEAGNDSIAIRPMIYLSCVFDHRVLDGEGADNFLMKVKQTLEQWK